MQFPFCNPTCATTGISAFDDIQPDRAIVVHGRDGRFSKGGGVEAMDENALLADLRALA